MNYDKILDTEYYFKDAEVNSLREYLHKLLDTLWDYGEGFSSKRPFGNSGWEEDIFHYLAHMGAIESRKEEDEYVWYDSTAGGRLVFELIKYIFFGNKNIQEDV